MNCKEALGNMKKACNYVMIALISVISSISVCLETRLVEVYKADNLVGKLVELFDAGLIDNTLMTGCVFIFMYIIGWFASKVLIKTKFIGVVSIAFSILTVLGKSYAEFNNWNYIFNDKIQFVFSLIIMFGYAMFYYALIKCIYYIADTGRLREKESTDLAVFDLKRFFLIAGFIFLCWIPYLYVFFPGSVPYDGYYQLNMFYGINTASNHHPWVSTLIIGLITMIGRRISDNFGVFLYVLIQSIFCAFSFSIASCKIYSYRISKWIKRGTVIYFAVLPVWGSYAQTLMKDVIYYGLFVLFSVLYIEIIEKRSILKKWKMISFVILGCLLVQYRNEGVYIVGLSIVLLIFVVGIHSRLKLFAAGTIIVAVHLLFSMIIIPGLGVKDGSIKEMLSVPFQQTARYVTTYEAEIPEEEKEIIDKVLGYNTIKTKYNPINSDPVKNSYRSPSKAEFTDYIKVWFRQLKNHPLCYIQATLNNCFGYLCPGYIQDSISNMQFYIKGEPLATGELNIYYIQNDTMRNSLSQYSLMWLKLPGISLLLYPGTYAWLLVLGVVELLRHRKFKDCISASLLFFTIAICLISPVNGYLRYMLPVMAAMPLFVSFVLKTINDK